MTDTMEKQYIESLKPTQVDPSARTYKVPTAEIDYTTGMFTIIRSDLAILEIKVYYQTKLPGAWL